MDTILQCVADDASHKTASFSFSFKVDMELPKTEFRFAVNDGSARRTVDPSHTGTGR